MGSPCEEGEIRLEVDKVIITQWKYASNMVFKIVHLKCNHIFKLGSQGEVNPRIIIQLNSNMSENKSDIKMWMCARSKDLCQRNQTLS